jgi:hypothetical protein
VEYADRSQAEYAARQLQGSLTVKGRPLTLTWAQSRPVEHPLVSANAAPPQRIAFGRDEDSQSIPLPPGISRVSDLPPHLRTGSETLE